MWTQERCKKRTTFQHTAFNYWKCDYTEVDISPNRNNLSSAQKKYTEYEIEFEVNEEFKLWWLKQSDVNTVNKCAYELAQQLAKLIDLLVPYESETAVEHSLVDVTANGMESKISLVNSVIQQVSSNKRGGFDFLGSMPVNLSRQNLRTVINSGYFLTEKTDGVRYLLYIVDDEKQRPMAVLVNRSKKVFTFRGSYDIGRSLTRGSILDGELVYSLQYKENVFLIFDVLAWNGESCIAQPFSERMNTIRNVIMPAYSQHYVENNTLPPQQQPMKIIRKEFYDKSKLPELLGRLAIEDGERVFNDKIKRYHKSDGIIFQPDAEYIFSRNFDLLKWKWPELRSIDLKVCIDRESHDVYLMCQGEEGTQINCTKRGTENIGLGVYDSYRLRADCEELVYRNQSAIAEVSYDVAVGMWAYHHLRKDKNEPNFIVTVMGVFMEQAESIGVDELEYILNAASNDMSNDYDHQMNKMKTKLVSWQREEVKRQQK